MGLQLSWLERAPDKREVPGSNPGRPTNFKVITECVYGGTWVLQISAFNRRSGPRIIT